MKKICLFLSLALLLFAALAFSVCAAEDVVFVAEGGTGDFVPMNANFGLVTRLGFKVRGGKAKRNEALSERALAALDTVLADAKL